MKTIVVYHHPCLDGFASRLAAQYHLELDGITDVEYVEGSYGTVIDPKIFSGADIYLVDFSYKRDALKRLCQMAYRVTVLDHHESAEHDLFLLTEEVRNLRMYYTEANKMGLSGVGITWWFFATHGTNRRSAKLPKVFAHVQDRDLWNFKLTGTREICAALSSFEFNWSKWYEAVFHNTDESKTLLAMGETLTSYTKSLHDQLASTVQYEDLFGHKHVPVFVNCPPMLFSELAERFYTPNSPLVAGRLWNHSLKLWTWSVRSHKDFPIVADIAVRYGGGGNPHAGGFVSKTEKPELKPQQ